MASCKDIFAYLLFLSVGNCIFYNINAVFLELPIILAKPVPEGMAISSLMTFAAQSGNVFLIAYLLFWPKSKQPPLRTISIIFCIVCIGNSFEIAYAWDIIINKHSVFLILGCAIAGSMASVGNLFFWPWTAQFHVTYTSAISAGMGLSAVIASALGLCQVGGIKSPFTMTYYYIVAAGFNSLALVSVLILEFTSLGQSCRKSLSRRPSSASINTNINSNVKIIKHYGSIQDERTRSDSFVYVDTGPINISQGRGIVTTNYIPPRNNYQNDADSVNSDDEDPDALLLPRKFKNAPSVCYIRQRFLLRRTLMMFALGFLTYGWLPGLLPYFAPSGMPLVIFQAVGQVVGVFGRIISAAPFPKRFQNFMVLLNIGTFMAMACVASYFTQKESWYLPAMCCINAVFSIGHGIGSTLIMMRSDGLIKKPDNFEELDQDTLEGLEGEIQNLETQIASQLGAAASFGSGLGGISVYFAVAYWIDPAIGR